MPRRKISPTIFKTAPRDVHLTACLVLTSIVARYGGGRAVYGLLAVAS